MGVFVVSVVVLTLISGVPAVSATRMSAALLQFLAGLVVPGLAYVAPDRILVPVARNWAMFAAACKIWVAGIASR